MQPCFWLPLYAQVQRHGWNGVIVKEVSPGVSVIRDGATYPIYKSGMALYENDEVQTGKNGSAVIRFSSNENGNEITLGPECKIRVSRTSSKFDYSIYRVTVLKGKIRAKDRPSQSRKVQVNAGKSKFIPFGGKYVVEQSGDQTLAANAGGNIRILDKTSNRFTTLPPDRIASVSAKTGTLTLMVIPEPLMTDFKTNAASDKSSKEIQRLVHNRVSGTDEILAQETKEATEKAAAGTKPIQREVKTDKQQLLKTQKKTPSAKKSGQRAVTKKRKKKISKQVKQKSKRATAQSPVRIKKKKQKPQAVVKRKPIISQEAKPKEESLLQKLKWDIVTGSTALVFAWLATEEANKYNDLESENKSLKEQFHDNQANPSVQNDLEVQYEVNKEKMATHEYNVTLYNTISILAVLFEGYLIYQHIFDDDPDDHAANYHPGYQNVMNPDTVTFGFNDPSSPTGIRLSLDWKW